MRYLIRFSIIVLLISLTYESFAQTFGIKAGLNLSDMFIKESELYIPYENLADDKTRIIPGFHVGASAELPLFDLFSVEADLLFSTKGTSIVTKEPFGSETLVTKEKQDLYYLELPLIVKVPFSIQNFKLFGFAGGYGGLGLAGKINTSYTFGDLEETEKETIKWGSEEGSDYLKRIDYGIKFGAGLNWKSFQVGLAYNLGLANISADSEIGSVIKNRGLGLSLGYMFGGTSKSGTGKIKDVKSTEAGKQEKPSKGKSVKTYESERLSAEKARTDSLARVADQQEKIRLENAKAESIEAAKVLAEKAEAERSRIEKLKADSIAAAQKAAAMKPQKDAVIYRVQFLASFNPGSRSSISVAAKEYPVYEYLYLGAYRLCVGEFTSLAPAIELRNTLRQTDYPQAFITAFKNNERALDPELFKEQPSAKPAVTEEKQLPEATKEIIAYRIQILSNSTSKSSYNININNKAYKTFEYNYAGAYRICIGEFSTLNSAKEFQNICRKNGYPQAFVVAFKNNVRSTDPALFK